MGGHRFLLMYTLHEDEYYGSDAYLLQGSLAIEHNLAMGFCLMVIHYSSEGSKYRRLLLVGDNIVLSS